MNPSLGRMLTIEQALFFAQNCRCFYCSSEFEGPPSKRHRRRAWTRDHLLPAAKGHGHARNTVLACAECNSDKGSQPATAEQLARAAAMHAEALRLCQMFNGCKPPEWTGDREPTPTMRAIEMAGLKT